MTFSRKIGGEMPWANESPVRSTTEANLRTSSKTHQLWLNTGRSALAIALRTLRKIKSCSRIWIPAFICPSVPETCAREGYDIRSYAVNDRLQIISSSVTDTQAGDAFLTVHYFGFRNDEATNLLKEKGLWIIEDAVQAAFTEGIGEVGHFFFNSLRKFTPLPDGAWLGSDFPLEEPFEQPDREFLSQRMEGKRRKACGAPDADYLRLFSESEARLDRDACPRVASDLSMAMLSSLDLSVIAQRRRENFTTLLSLLATFPSVRPIYDELLAGVVPLGLPVTLENGKRDALRNFLMQNGVFCPIHWLLSDKIPKLQNQEAWDLSEKIMTFPIDQRYTQDDMEFIASMLKKSGMVS